MTGGHDLFFGTLRRASYSLGETYEAETLSSRENRLASAIDQDHHCNSMRSTMLA
jgi:hypothetical protein